MLFTVLLSKLVLLSTAVIALKAMTLTFIEDNINTAFSFDTGDGDPNPTALAALPKELYDMPAKLAMIASVISIFVAVGHLVFICKDWKKGEKTQAYSFRRNTMFLHLSNFIIILFSLVSIYITHKSSSHFFLRYVMRKAGRPNTEEVRYNLGRFDLETWSCELKDIPGARMVKEDYSRQCMVEAAGRWVMIPFMIVSFAVAVLAVWGMLGGRRDANGERMKTEDVGLEMGKLEGKFNAI
ncbi:hypothetical protein P154DRAFT_474950 [Amniculicola lignicola CBS 123094]|uniref:Uncharacterized protein n=1 Tax=Amniculicola lignicola CBS 123094 TaxID=1392246 RepID=A0A6A5W7H8_9PLEO|nr:hypothetical protein P154DRAFT_474950 [Amniculicola lignicola CBS 123094]